MKKHPPSGAIGRARTLRDTMTDAERKLWSRLRLQQLGGYRFRRQVPFGNYIADFARHEARLVIEIDGGQHDLSSAKEIQWTNFISKEGYRVLRFWNPDVMQNIEGVCLTILHALQNNPFTPTTITPTLTLPHQGGGNTTALEGTVDSSTSSCSARMAT